MLKLLDIIYSIKLAFNLLTHFIRCSNRNFKNKLTITVYWVYIKTISNKEIISEEIITEKVAILVYITISTMWKKKLVDNLKKLKEYYI